MVGAVTPTAHWDDVPSARFDVGPMGADWDLLGTAAGCDRVGLRRIRVSPGKQSPPVHAHFGEEEIFYVLRGDGFSWQEQGVYEIGEGDEGELFVVLEGDGVLLLIGPDGEEEHPVRAGSLVSRRPGSGVAHGFRAGEQA
jgi:uncharacterized cupin superfamily protein